MGNQKSKISDDGFELENMSGRRATLWLSTIGHLHVRYHCEITEEATAKRVTVSAHSIYH